MCTYYILTSYQISTLSFPANAIKWIGIAEIRIAPYVAHEVFYLRLKYFSVQLDSMVNFDTNKYFLDLPISHLIAYSSPTKLFIDFPSGGTIDLKMK